MFIFVSHLTVGGEERDELQRHSREPAGIMARSGVRHEAYEVLMDSRREPEWLA